MTIETILETWFEPRVASGLTATTVAQAEGDVGVVFPSALRSWLLRYGGRSDLWCIQDQLFCFEVLSDDGDVLLIGRENQDVVRWGIRLNDDDDPPVLESPGGHQQERVWMPITESITSFAVMNALLAVKFSPNAHHACGECEDDTIAAARELLPGIPAPTTSFVRGEFYGHPAGPVLVEIDADTWLWISARSEQALRDTRRRLGVSASDWDQWVH